MFTLLHSLLIILVATTAMPRAAIATPDLEAEHQIECPPMLAADALAVTNSPPDRPSHVANSFRLNFAGPMAGPPSAMNILTGETGTSRSGKHIVKWKLNQPSQSFTEGKWMACFYGHANNVILSRRIDDRTSSCTVSYASNAYGFQNLDIRCMW